MDHSLEVQMLNALEFFHYSYRFQQKIFVLCLSDEKDLSKVVTDLRVLNASKIKCVVVLNQKQDLFQSVEEWKKRGYPFEFISFNTNQFLSTENIKDIYKNLDENIVSIIGINHFDSDQEKRVDLDEFTIQLASHFVTDKVFFLSEVEALTIDGEFISHLTPDEAQQRIKKGLKVNIGHDRLNCLINANLEFGFEIVLLEGESGSLFQEIFTHRGKGTLLTNDYPNIIRRGKKSDVMDISLLLKPYISSGSILKVTEDSIADEVEDYYVYTVNNSIVAISKLTDHGSAIELAKFCTLPRYQGKGRARELAEKMIQTVKDAKKDYIFALSVEPKMYEFFKSLGFSECERETLPDNWQAQYDLCRPSRAFKLIVNKDRL